MNARWQDALRRLNRATFWQTTFRVWGQTLFIPSADRLLYAALHILGLMGRADRRFFLQNLKPGMAVLDIGANIGLYAAFFSALVGEKGSVQAFEPDPDLYPALERVGRLNGRANLRVHALGLGETNERRTLRQSFFNSGDNRIGPTGAPIELARGDDIIAGETIDFIKIDVQGWEMHALRGLEQTIARSPRLQIYLEYWPQGLRDAGNEPRELWEFLTSAGFALFRPHGSGWHGVGSLEALNGWAKDAGYVNLWARKGA